jgi:type VII secretion integral membrane protein EccD
MCRLVVYGPDRHAELAVPAHVLVGDLVPALLPHLGADLADSGLAHGGWVLQRLGDPPLDEDTSVSASGLRDGDSVHLRPRSGKIPPADFDDLIDGIATGVQARAGGWQPRMVRNASLGVVALLIGVVALALGRPGPGPVQVLGALVLAVVCLTVGLALSRVAHDPGVGTVVASGAIVFGGLAAVGIPSVASVSPTTAIGAPHLFAGAVSVLALSALAALAVGGSGAYFAAVISATAIATVGTALCVFAGVTAPQAAAAAAVFATIATANVPIMAFRLSGLRLAPLPTAPEHLQEDIDPEPSGPVLSATARADRFMTGLYSGLGAAAAVAMVVAATGPGWAPTTLVATTALARLLAARPMSSLYHRLAAGLPAVGGLAMAVVSLSGAIPPMIRVVSLASLLGVGGAFFVTLARREPGRRLMPYWGQVGDILQTLSTVAMFPLLLAVLDVYGLVRAIGG